MTTSTRLLRSASLTGAVLTTGLIAGFFYAYAASVNRGLAQLDDAAYIAAMQSISATVRNGLFALSFFGAAVFLLLATAAHARGRSPRLVPIAAAAALYVLGGLVLTFAASVPLNDQLAAVDLDAGSQALAQARADYEATWNAWNAARTVASTAALGCLVWALRRPDAEPDGSPTRRAPAARSAAPGVAF